MFRPLLWPSLGTYITKYGHTKKLQTFLNQPTEVKYYVLTIFGLKSTAKIYNVEKILC